MALYCWSLLPTHLLLATIDLFFVPIVLPFSESDIMGIIECVAFWVQLLPLSTTHILACISRTFLHVLFLNIKKQAQRGKTERRQEQGLEARSLLISHPTASLATTPSVKSHFLSPSKSMSSCLRKYIITEPAHWRERMEATDLRAKEVMVRIRVNRYLFSQHVVLYRPPPTTLGFS